MSRLMIKAAGKSESWSPIQQWITALMSLALVLTLDAITSAQVTLVVFYLMVAGFAAWSLGERKGLLFAILVVTGGATIRHMQYAAHPGHGVPAATEAWNVLARGGATMLVVLLVSGMRSALQLERWRASTDGLTGVLNKASFHRHVMAKVEAARGSNAGFVLCYMDLDGFKLVNDRYGHSAGDEILRLFANAAVDAIREDDLFARIGGDEFVAMMAVPHIDDGDRVASIAHNRLTAILASTGLPVTCSMGAVIASADQMNPIEAAIQLADALMYEVKKSGRDALRVGRIDPTKIAPQQNSLEIQSDVAASAHNAADSALMVRDRRAA